MARAHIVAAAIEAHDNCNHLYDGKSYSVHLAMVAAYAQKYSGSDTAVEAAWLHDVIEDARLTYNDILKLTESVAVADIVYAVTNEKGRTRTERANDKYYQGIRETPGATFVKLCDRAANIEYSKSTGSRMFQVYRKEMPEFIDKVATPGQRALYSDLISAINRLLHTP